MKQTLVRNRMALGLFLMISPIVAIGGLPTYEPISSLSGELKIDGSDTVGKAAEVWVEEFKVMYPDVSIKLTQQGSGDGAKAVLNSTADIGNMSRKMKPKELKLFSDSFGYKPTELRVGVDAVAVFSSKGLGIDQLTIDQVDQVLSVVVVFSKVFQKLALPAQALRKCQNFLSEMQALVLEHFSLKKGYVEVNLSQKLKSFLIHQS